MTQQRTTVKPPSTKAVVNATANFAHQANVKLDAVKAEQDSLRALVEKGFDEIKGTVIGAKDATLSAIKKPETWTDRFLTWWRDKDASWLGWVVLGLVLAITFSVGRAIGSGGQ